MANYKIWKFQNKDEKYPKSGTTPTGRNYLKSDGIYRNQELLKFHTIKK